MAEPKRHWESVYAEKAPDEVSWYEPMARRSLELIQAARPDRDAAVLDAGGGASPLAGELLDAGYRDVTVVDISARALEEARAALGDRADRVSWVVADLLTMDLGRTFDIWHDRAVFHFLVEPADRRRYLEVLERHLAPDGDVVIATFAPDGPTQCSGLPVVRYGPDELRETFGEAYTLEAEIRSPHVTPGGSTQQFFYAHLSRSC